MSAPPVHVVPDLPGHGVVLHARQVADAVGAEVLDLPDVLGRAPAPVHVHVADRLFGATGEATAERLVALARRQPTTVTLHDVPQDGDGPVLARRVAAYASVLAAADGWAVSSEHERDLVHRHLAPLLPAPLAPGLVVPLPVMPLPGARSGPAGSVPRGGPAAGRPLVVGLLGWVYPGKGHAEVLHACAAVAAGTTGARGAGRGVVLRALGRVSAGHDDLAADLADLADRLGVGLEVTGWVGDDDLAGALGDVDVPVAAHRHVSASGSVNSWLAAGRRPLVTDGTYAREMAALRPGTLQVVPGTGLADAITRAAAEPRCTWLEPGAGLRPGLADSAAAYLAWWRDRGVA